MPLYEYSCEECGHKFEAVVSVRDAESAMKCVGCGATTRRLFPSRGAFHLKGRGWSRDGYGYPSPSEKAALV